MAMPFEKGKSGNPTGRRTGTPNVVTRDLRENIKTLLEEQFEQVATDLRNLDPKARVDAWLKMAEFVLPKLNRSQIDATVTPQVTDGGEFTPEQAARLRALFDEVENNPPRVYEITQKPPYNEG